MPKKLGLALATLAFLFFPFLIASPVTAQTQTYANFEECMAALRSRDLCSGYWAGTIKYANPEKKAYVEGSANDAGPNIYKTNYHALVSVWSGTGCLFSDVSGNCQENGSQLGGRTVTGTLASLIGGMYTNPPADTGTYVADLMRSTTIASPAYAQGLGFSSLTPILNAWKIFRNLAYLFFIVIILAIGFMIMFRQKLSGQTVVTAQQALPNVVISLIFVTFSYAIAGLLIDAMYLLMFLILGVFGYLTTDAQNQFLTANFFQVGVTLITGGIGSAGIVMDQLIQSVFESGPLTDALASFSGLAAQVIFAIAIAIGIFRLFFELLKTYVYIILNIVLSPVFLMLGALPGRNVFADWIKDLVGNLSAFPAVLVILVIYDTLTRGITGDFGDTSQALSTYERGGFLPPYLLGYGSGGAIFTFVIGLGMLLAITEIVKEVKKIMGAKENFGWFASGLQDALKRGWQGGELIPGVAATNTSKYGISGQNVITQTVKAPFVGIGRMYNKRQQRLNEAERTVHSQSDDVRQNVTVDRAEPIVKPNKK